MKIIGGIAAALLLCISVAPAHAQTEVARLPGFANGGDVQAQVAAMLAEMKPDQGFMWRALVRNGETVAAIEIWKKPGRPAVHTSEAEYAIVLEGHGTLVFGGTLVEPKTVRAGFLDGDRIEGGTTRVLGPGDVILIPAGVPHWFGVTGDRLVLLGIKLPNAK